MEIEINSDALRLIKENLITLASSTFDLITILMDDENVDENVSLENTLKKFLQNDSADPDNKHSNEILSVIRDIDSIQDNIEKDNKLFDDLLSRYNNFVDAETTKATGDKDKRYQTASDFFSFIATTIIQQKKETTNSIKTIDTINEKLSRLEYQISRNQSDKNMKKIEEIVKFAASLEKSIVKLVKEFNIAPEEILPPK